MKKPCSVNQAGSMDTSLGYKSGIQAWDTSLWSWKRQSQVEKSSVPANGAARAQSPVLAFSFILLASQHPALKKGCQMSHLIWDFLYFASKSQDLFKNMWNITFLVPELKDGNHLTANDLPGCAF